MRRSRYRKRSRRAYRKRRRSFRRRGARTFTRRVKRALMRVTEPKILPLSLVTYFPAVDNTWEEHSLGVLNEGVASQQRIGEKYWIESVYINGTLAGGQGAAGDDAYNMFRIVLGLWTTEASTTPLAVLGANLDDPLWPKFGYTGLDPPQLHSRLKWKIFDKLYKLQSPGMQAEGDLMPAIKHISIYKKFKKPILMRFGNTTTTYANHYLVLSMLSDSSTVPSPGFILGSVYVKIRDF